VTEPVAELLQAHWHRYQYAIDRLEKKVAGPPIAPPGIEAETEGLVLSREASQWLTSPCVPTLRQQQQQQGRDDGIDSPSRLCLSEDFSVTAAVVSRFLLPPRSRLLLTLPLTKSFAGRELHQTDASRGLDTHPAVVALRLVYPRSADGGGAGELKRRIGSEWSVVVAAGELVTLPFPDASMPFNVITLVRSSLYIVYRRLLHSLVWCMRRLAQWLLSCSARLPTAWSERAVCAHP
jgi:hypothetical protein